MGTSDTEFSSRWKTLYQTALFELDGTKMVQRTRDAERAVMDRIEEVFCSTRDGVGDAALMRALTVLRDLRRMAKDGNGG